MGAATIEIDAWLRDGGLVVTANDRAARALAAAFHRARRAEGLGAWPAPKILDWKSFVRTAWDQRATDARMVLNSAQEQALWVSIVAESNFLATLLEGPRHRLAAMAQEAHELLCSYAPQCLRASARAAWQQDAAAFSGWLGGFDEACRAENLISPGLLPLELIALLMADTAQRPPLLLVGFDRILPVQRSLFEAWGEWREAARNAPAAEIQFHAADDPQAELAACALWCGQQIAAQPKARLLVVAQSVKERRGEFERAFLRHAKAPFEFSLGIPLSQVVLARAAHLMLRWLDGPLAEVELDWLLSTGHAAASRQESAALQTYMRALRRSNLERSQWALGVFLNQRFAAELLPASWVERITAVQRRLTNFAHRVQRPFDWADLIPQLLDGLSFAASSPLSSAEYQAVCRWQKAVEACGSLGFDGRRIGWKDFLSQLSRVLDETLFAPESRDAPIQIAGPAESAGLTADAIWFLGADEDAWPAGGATHPLLPIEVQREAGMPHATPQLDWDLATGITNRLLDSADEVHFSYARLNAAIDARPSRLMVQFAGPAQALAGELQAPAVPEALTVSFEDHSQIPYPSSKVAGGASVLTAQSQCPFKAFATARLDAQNWEPAEAGLTPSQRGNLLHAVLHAGWDRDSGGIHSRAELQSLNDREAFVANHVQRIFAQELRPSLRERMPRRYLELEEQRLTMLVLEWLEHESTRIDFEVADTEIKRTVHLAGVNFDLRLDRLDRLNDGSLLVIDYKSGKVSPSCWDLPRPDDVQLPLYAGFAIDHERERLGGLVFAKVRPGEMGFSGRVDNAATTLFPGLKTAHPLLKTPFSETELEAWKQCIEQLASDFVAGRAEVDPREAPKTCEHCGLQTLCRIYELTAQLDSEDDSEDEEAGDE